MGGAKPKATTSNGFWSSVGRLVVPEEKRLFCVVCKVPRHADAVVERASDSINPSGYEDPSVHPDVLVAKRVHGHIESWGYACIVLRDFESLKMMYDVNWGKMQRDIFQHKKKDAYALLYSGDLSRAAENAMKNHFERKISMIVDNYQSFFGNTHVKILTIEGTKTNGRHLSCDFVDVQHAKVILSSYKKFHDAGGDNFRVEPHQDEV